MGPYKSNNASNYSDGNMWGTDSDDDDEQEYGHKKAKMSRGSEGYTQRRDRNNVAVRKSRDKSRKKAKDTMEKVNRLRAENEVLEQRVQILTKELCVLKDIFMSHANSFANTDNKEVLKSSETIESDHKYFKEEK